MAYGRWRIENDMVGRMAEPRHINLKSNPRGQEGEKRGKGAYPPGGLTQERECLLTNPQIRCIIKV
jgi:hypothetical protein